MLCLPAAHSHSFPLSPVPFLHTGPRSWTSRSWAAVLAPLMTMPSEAQRH